ncbi:hypothetical protein CAPTEDRAFT_163285 [Capitella teleta]|uniref:PPPDE domain-containing protein n=1 Tax=Capitella teleta TaxID=283909 RepID=R7UWP4_CAPTE|nr:hypothetical protein CAPTEDRAFT_163285 [Capitella teleta]|eukprot:ELU08362.1 hypothetical protein CAPTEDRAFT_163285 [Capitella teleta]
MAGFPVKVYIYDVSRGMARAMSQALIGRQIDGVWHTGIVVYGQEYFFGAEGISSCPPGGTIMGQPDTITDLGTTEIPQELMMTYLEELSRSSFRPECYNLFEHNCNNFSNELAQFLTGKGIPSHIISLPQEVMQTPFGAMIKQFMDSSSVNPGGNQLNFNHSAHNAAAAPVRVASTNPQDSSISFRDAKIVDKFIEKQSELKSKFSETTFTLLGEVHEFLSTKDCTWSLGKNHLDALINSENALLLGLLQQTLLNEDIVNLIIHCPESFWKLFSKFRDLSDACVNRLVKCVCNCCLSDSGRAFMLSAEKSSEESPLVRVSQLCTHCLLHDNESLNCLGSALACVLSAEKMNLDLAVEVGIALVQLVSKGVSTDAAPFVLRSLHKCMDVNAEVTSIAACMEMPLESLRTKDRNLHFTAIEEKLKKINTT